MTVPSRIKVISALATSADGYITGPDPSPEQALGAGLLDEVTVHQVPVLLGGGTPFFGALSVPVELDVVKVVTAPGVTHLTFAIRR